MPPNLILIFLVLLFLFVAWLIITYNRFIKYRNRIEESWSGIEVALKRRFNLIPNLVRSVEGYSKHEADIFKTKSDHLADLKDVADRTQEESRISKSLRGLLALAQAYPELKASANFIELQNSLNETEEDIQQARNRYNRFVGRFNTLVESFPAVYIARKGGFVKQAYFTLDLATQRELPEVEFPAPRVSRQ